MYRECGDVCLNTLGRGRTHVWNGKQKHGDSCFEVFSVTLDAGS